MDEPQPTQQLTLLEFRIEPHRFAIACAQVREVLPMLPIRPLIGAPAAIVGVARVRDALLPLLDPRARLGLPERAPRVEDHIVVVECNGQRLGLVVDAAEDVFQASSGDVCHPGRLEPRVAYSIGVVKRHDEELLLVDLDAMVHHDDWEEVGHAVRSTA